MVPIYYYRHFCFGYVSFIVIAVIVFPCFSAVSVKLTTTDHLIFGNMTTEQRLHSKLYDRAERPHFLSGKQ